MTTITFDKLLLQTAFCCMASDGHIDNREISIIKSMCTNSNLFTNFNFQDEINQLVTEINDNGKEFVSYYLNLLSSSNLSESEELILINFAIQTIKADEQIEYSEIKFFKNIRYRLNLTDEIILKSHPDIEMFLEQDIITSSSLDKFTKEFLDAAELPNFDLISLVDESLDKKIE